MYNLSSHHSFKGHLGDRWYIKRAFYGIREGMSPKDIFPDHWELLETLMNKGAGRTDVPYTQTYGLD